MPDAKTGPDTKLDAELDMKPVLQPDEEGTGPGGQEFQLAARWAREAAIHAAGRPDAPRQSGPGSEEEGNGHTTIRNIQICRELTTTPGGGKVMRLNFHGEPF